MGAVVVQFNLAPPPPPHGFVTNMQVVNSQFHYIVRTVQLAPYADCVPFLARSSQCNSRLGSRFGESCPLTAQPAASKEPWLHVASALQVYGSRGVTDVIFQGGAVLGAYILITMPDTFTHANPSLGILVLRNAQCDISFCRHMILGLQEGAPRAATLILHYACHRRAPRAASSFLHDVCHTRAPMATQMFGS